MSLNNHFRFIKKDDENHHNLKVFTDLYSIVA
jgi:hypothetical protein